MADDTAQIRGGIEWFTVETAHSPEDDCQCARCGSSAVFSRCGNCVHGYCERDSWDGCGDSYDERCDWCDGKGGSWVCCSGRAWCDAHPMPGRERIESTAYERDEVYDDCE